jgi:hypothetical protein
VPNPFDTLALDVCKNFRLRSYHRTAAESYYGGQLTCKGRQDFFLTFFLQGKLKSAEVWHSQALMAVVDTADANE